MLLSFPTPINTSQLSKQEESEYTRGQGQDDVCKECNGAVCGFFSSDSGVVKGGKEEQISRSHW